MQSVRILLLAILFVICSIQQHAYARSGLTSYWTCQATDNNGGEWNGRSKFRRLALNKAWDACKNNSDEAGRCKVAKEWCNYHHGDVSMRRAWRCTAFDSTGDHWRSDFQLSRQEAVLSSRHLCKSYSSLPDTCQVRLITCKILKL